MNDEFFDEVATRQVANRAVISSGFALFGAAAVVVPLASVVVIPFLLIALVVAISAIRTLNHPDARVIGGLRQVAIAAAGIGIGVAILGIAFRVFLLVRA